MATLRAVEARKGQQGGTPGASAGRRPAPRSGARLRRAVPIVLGALLAVATWLVYCEAVGFQLSPDSMSYAALARAFDSGRWFTTSILWLGDQAGRFQADWPPLYPAVVAIAHGLGWSLADSEWLVSGLGFTAAVVCGLLAIRAATGRLPWMAVPVMAAFPVGLYVAGFGWSEPLCLALLGIHCWLLGLAAAAGGTRARWLWFAEGLAAGLAFLDRYAAIAFLPVAVLFPFAVAWAARRGAAGAPPAPADPWSAVAGVALPVVPWTAAALLLTGHLGTQYLPDGAGLGGALRMGFRALDQSAGMVLLSGGGRSPAVRHAAAGFVPWCLVCWAGAVVLPRRVPRFRAREAPAASLATWLLVALAVDVVASGGLLILLRARYYFDVLDPRLLAPTLYVAALAGLALVSLIRWRVARDLVLLPLAAILLWHGTHWARTAEIQPRLGASLAGPWCTPGASGDCLLLDWLAEHTGAQDLIVGNNPFLINFVLDRTTEEVAPYPFNPALSQAELSQWTRAWLSTHPVGRVWVALDSVAGPLNSSGPLMLQFWDHTAVTLGDGLQAQLATTGPAYRVWAVTLQDERTVSPNATELGGA